MKIGTVGMFHRVLCGPDGFLQSPLFSYALKLLGYRFLHFDVKMALILAILTGEL